ncbi:MAG TPA: hypothetical protein VF816_01555 [Rhodocyclaceae bacterium]
MNDFKEKLPTIVTALLVGAALGHGPIHQLSHYHEFADQTGRFGVDHFADVASNLGFLLVALWGFVRLAPQQTHPAMAGAWAGYRLFLIGLLLTAFGSAYYHLAPDDARLVWDRLPIALACAGLLAGAWSDTHDRPSANPAALLALFAVASVAWWYFGALAGNDDLRPYLMLQVLPFVLIPLWQSSYDVRPYDRWYFGAALLLYAAAKGAEVGDHQIAALLGVTGHTLKHLLATLSSALIVAALDRRVRCVARGSVAAVGIQ